MKCTVCFITNQSRMKYDKVHNIYNKLLAIEDIDPTLVYIQYMKFARRAEGIKSGRTIFKKAREDPRTRHHVYVTAALMEYYCSKVSARRQPEQRRSESAAGTQRRSLRLVFSPMQDKSVAFKIFELGLKKYGDIPEYILAYIDYLSHLNGTSPVKAVDSVVHPQSDEVSHFALFLPPTEDNNTRVLFERVLTSGSLSQEKSG